MTRREAAIALGATGALLALGRPARAAEGTSQAPPSVAALARKIVDAGYAAGLSLAAIRNGQQAYAQGFGLAESGDVAATTGTRYAIGSLTKQFTATAVLLLAAEGKLALEDPLGKFVPELPNVRSATIRQLLNQTAGLHNYPDLREHPWPPSGTIDPARILAILGSDKPDFAPGERYAYSNANYAALAATVERASGRDYATFLRERFFEPLGMSDTGYGFAAQREPIAAPMRLGAWIPPDDRISLDLFWGAGGIVSTVRDFAKWQIALLGDVLIDSASRTAMWTEATTNEGRRTGYGMGFVPAELDGRHEVWHNGYAPSAGGYCYASILPDDAFAIVILTNSPDPAVEPSLAAIVREAATQALGARLAAPNPQPVAGEDPLVTARLRGLLAAIREGTLDRSALTPAFSAFLSPETLSSVRPFFATLGDPQPLIFLRKRVEPAGVTYEYNGAYADGHTHRTTIAFEGDKIAGAQVVP